jgi:hypothetical protein
MMTDPLEDLFAQLSVLPFRPTKAYDPPHEYLMSKSIPDGLAVWHRVRLATRDYGVIRPFYKSNQVWKYLDAPDGYTYWIMPKWLLPDWQQHFDPSDNYVINRQRTDVAKSGRWLND